MTWELNVILALLLVLGPHSAGGTTGSADELPHPLLTENRSARVLKLVCKPPPDVKDWEKVYDLRLFGFLPQRRSSKNMSLAVVTSHAQEPRREEDVPDIAQVQFSGNWDTLSVSLSMFTPITGTELGDYFCTMQYGRRGTTGNHPPTFSTKVSVQILQPWSLSSENFEVSIIDAHEVNVTWRSPKMSKFIQASVSRTFTDKNGRDTTAGRSLFTTNSSGTGFVYDSQVILTKFESPPGATTNYSMRLYVESKLCQPYCRYSCDVPYKGCFGRDVQFCVCSQEDLSRNQIYSSQRTVIKDAIIGITVFLCVALIIILAGLYCLFKTGKYRKFKCLRKFVANLEKPDKPDPRNRTRPGVEEQNKQEQYAIDLPKEGSAPRNENPPADPPEQDETPVSNPPKSKNPASIPPRRISRSDEDEQIYKEVVDMPPPTSSAKTRQSCTQGGTPPTEGRNNVLSGHPPSSTDPENNNYEPEEPLGAVGGAPPQETTDGSLHVHLRNETTPSTPVQSTNKTGEYEVLDAEKRKEPKCVVRPKYGITPSNSGSEHEALIAEEGL